ncbi:MAG: hypothetical protein FJ030_12610 [Chloroflexi bacterium]|nr:hypothetical protein [Chloroflexota bacterium]
MIFFPGSSLASRYRIDALIGRGGSAIVYRGHDPLMDRAVAIKIFPSDLIGDEEAARQFATELRVIGQLEHPNILPIYDCGHHGKFRSSSCASPIADRWPTSWPGGGRHWRGRSR